MATMGLLCVVSIAVRVYFAVALRRKSKKNAEKESRATWIGHRVQRCTQAV